MIDLNTGVRTPLPEAIIRSLGRTAEGRGAESQYAASSDGSLLAYVGTDEEGSPQIFIVGIDGTEIRVSISQSGNRKTVLFATFFNVPVGGEVRTDEPDPGVCGS